MSDMIDNPFVTLTIIAGPAILTNACAILQNSATMRYGLAVPQWREFRASIAAKDGLLAELYADPDAALGMAERRIRLLLRGLDCLYAAVALFGLGSLIALVGAVMAGQGRPLIPIWLVIGVGAVGLALLSSAMTFFVFESRCARGMLRHQLDRFGHRRA